MRWIQQRFERQSLPGSQVLHLVNDARTAHANHALDLVATVDDRSRG